MHRGSKIATGNKSAKARDFASAPDLTCHLWRCWVVCPCERYRKPSKLPTFGKPNRKVGFCHFRFRPVGWRVTVPLLIHSLPPSLPPLVHPLTNNWTIIKHKRPEPSAPLRSAPGSTACVCRLKSEDAFRGVPEASRARWKGSGTRREQTQAQQLKPPPHFASAAFPPLSAVRCKAARKGNPRRANLYPPHPMP